MTERLWLTEPARKTAHAAVVELRRDAFRVDRSLYCPRSSTYRHPQDPDQGTVWTDDGEKRKLVSVFEEAGEVWHRLRDRVPPVGARLNCHLDPEHRGMTSRAHTALHLLLEAVDPSVVLVGAEVKGGGTFRLDLGMPWVSPETVKGWFMHVRRRVDQDLPLRVEHVPRDVAKHKVRSVTWADGVAVPGPEHTLEVIFVGDDVRGIPCDGTFASRTSEVGEVVQTHAHANGKGGFVVVGQVRA